MTKEEKNNLYNELKKFYGEYNQLMICIEEMAELTKELVKYERIENNISSIAEEVADVEIMLEQVKQIFHIEDNVIFWKNKKLERTEKRLFEDIQNDYMNRPVIVTK